MKIFKKLKINLKKLNLVIKNMSTNSLEKYQKLQDKIAHLQNIELKNPERMDALQYNVEKLNNQMIQSISEFTEKSNYIEKSIESLNRLYKSKMLIKDNNEKRINKELQNTEENIKMMLEEHRNKMIKGIDQSFLELENYLNEMIKKQENDKIKINEQFDKLKFITQNEVPTLIKESENFDKNSKSNIESLRQILKEEVNYTKDLV